MVLGLILGEEFELELKLIRSLTTEAGGKGLLSNTKLCF